MPLVRTSFRVGALGCTCTIIACPETKQALVVDPGGEADRIVAELAARGLNAVQIVHTHAHFDHVLGTADLARATGAEASLHKEDQFLYDRVPDQLAAFGMAALAPPPGSGADLQFRLLEGNETLSFGRHEARVIHTPGHTPGSLCVLIEAPAERPLLLAGDTLFAGSIGRTDLWGGNFDEIVTSIRGPLFSLPDETLVIPGHGPETTIGLEREDNPLVGKYARV
jgi:glyoxylase-like metal-dependent hydrolase (beta-lactamase superfamily II)